jgi:hypothetical protein
MILEDGMHGPQPERRRFWRAALLALAAAALTEAGAVAADPDPEPPIYGAVRAALLDKRTEQGKPLGFHEANRFFSETPPVGALLVGFECGVGKFFDTDVIYAMRPLYQTAQGEFPGEDHGLFVDKRPKGGKVIKSKVIRTVSLRARPGYAVGAITVRSGLNINGFSLTYMRINGKVLDPDKSYTSDWVGNRGGGDGTTWSGNGMPVVGILGSQDEVHISSVGLVVLTPPAAPAKPKDDSPRAPKDDSPKPPKEDPPKPPKEDPPKPPKEDPPPVKERPVVPSIPAPPPKTEPPPRKADPPVRSADDPQKDEEPENPEPTAAPPTPQKAAPPPADEGPNWLPMIMMGAVALPVFLVLAAAFGVWGQSSKARPAGPSTSAKPPPLPPGSPTGVDALPEVELLPEEGLGEK